MIQEAGKQGGRRHVRLALLLSFGALLGKLLGFVREISFARLLGTSFVADSYRGAATATLLPIAPLQGDIVPSVLIPLYRQWIAEGQGARLFTPLAALFGVISLVITALVWGLADLWVRAMVPGFEPAAHDLTVQFVRVMALAMPASVMTSCMSCIEIAAGHSRITTLRSAVQNIATICGVAGVAITGRPLVLGISFNVGFWLLLLGGGGLLWREGAFAFRDIRLRPGLEAGGIFLRRVRPLLIQPLMDQGNILVERAVGSALGVGTIATLEYARTLTETAQFLVSQPIGYVVLAQEAPQGAAMRAQITALARPLLAFALPISLYIAIFAPEIVSIVYQRGAFDAHGVALTAGALRGIALGLWAATLGYILMHLLNAAHRNAAVARVFVAGFAANIVANFAITHYLGTFGLGLGETIRGAVFLAGACWLLDCGGLVLRLVLRQLPGLGLLGFACYGLRTLGWPPLATLAAAGVVVAVVCLAGAQQELRLVWLRLRPRLRGVG